MSRLSDHTPTPFTDDMFEQMSDEFGVMAEMEGVPAPPPEFLKAFVQQEVCFGEGSGSAQLPPRWWYCRLFINCLASPFFPNGSFVFILCDR